MTERQAANLMISNTEYHYGVQSLKLVDPVDKCAPWFFSNPISVTPGEEIFLAAWVKLKAVLQSCP
jgi:hypothetical protein